MHRFIHPSDPKNRPEHDHTYTLASDIQTATTPDTPTNNTTTPPTHPTTTTTTTSTTTTLERIDLYLAAAAVFHKHGYAYREGTCLASASMQMDALGDHNRAGGERGMGGIITVFAVVVVVDVASGGSRYGAIAITYTIPE